VDDPVDDSVDDARPDAGDDDIPVLVLAAMRDRMHSRRFSDPDDAGHVRVTVGTGDDAIHVVDDGPDRCMIGRVVGRAPDGCVYCLVARIALFGYEQLRDGDMAPVDAFSDSRDISLCGVFEVDGIVENIALVRHFRHGQKVPAEYLPTHPFLEFVDDDSPTDEE